MKFNWGTGLVIGALLFMTFVVVLVVKIMQTDVALVDTDYYEKGVNYQQTIDNKVGAESLLNIDVNEDLNALVFIKNNQAEEINGTATFYRPADKTKDFTTNIVLKDTLPFLININNFDKGTWKLSFAWKDAERSFLVEKEFNF